MSVSAKVYYAIKNTLNIYKINKLFLVTNTDNLKR